MARVTAAVRLGRQLRRLRQSRGLSQRALVRALGLSAHSNLVEYELGRRVPPGDIVVACERLLGDTTGSLRRLRAEALAERAELAEPDPTAAGPTEAAAGGPTGAAAGGPTEAAVERAAGGAAAGGPAAWAVVPSDRPAMLPAAVADFTGRAGPLAQLAALLEPAAAAPPALIIPAIAGTAGVGKTALAVRFAHQVADRFPDGQLYLDLRGYGPTPPMSAGQALAALLHALQVPAEQVPADPEQAAGRYRSLLAGRRMLVLLDNAHSAEQVRPLLPGTPGCLVLVTSRERLGGLIARDGARRITLDVLTPAESELLLARILGRDRVAAEPDAAAGLAGLCAHLPLALRIAAANLVDQPDRRIADYLAELRAGDPLAVLAVAGDDQGAVRVAFAASYARLPEPARRLFRLLGLVPGPDVHAAAAAALAGVDRAAADDQLRRLTAASLLAEPAPGRFSCHDLLRRYAADRARQDEDEPARAAAVRRLHDWYLQGSGAAARLLYPSTPLLPLPPAGVGAPEFGADTEALAWLEAERANLLAAGQQAAEHGPHAVAWLLADTLRGFFALRLYAADWLATAHAGLSAALAAGESRAAAAARLSLADAYDCQGRHHEALAEYTAVLAGTRQAGWTAGQVSALNSLGRVCWQLDRLDQAADHLAAALAIDRDTGSVRGQAIRLANLGAIHHEMGRLRVAAEEFTQALALARQTGQRRGEGICLTNLGMTYHGLGRLDAAFDHLTPALAVAREIGDSGNESHALRVLAEAHADAGRDDLALELASAAVAVAADLDDRHYQLETLTSLAAVHGRRGSHQAAADGYRQALALAREVQTRYPEIIALIGLATEQRQLGRPEPARADAEHALELARGTAYRMLEGNARTALAEAYRALGEPDRAVRHAEAALAVHRDTGHRLGEARTLITLGHALQARGGPGAARASVAAWTDAAGLFRGAGTRDVQAAVTLLAAAGNPKEREPR